MKEDRLRELLVSGLAGRGDTYQGSEPDVKTDELITLLASGLEPADCGRPSRRLLAGWAMGSGASLLVLAGVLRFNPALPREVLIPMFWARAAFCASLALMALVAVRRLGQPGARLGVVPYGLALPVAAMWLAAITELVGDPAANRIPLMLGHTAYVYPWLIALLAVPLFIALIWALQSAAPTHLRLAGGAAGLAAGAGGALMYTLHCPELAPPLLALWYVLGMLIPAGIGAGLGPRVLRW